ncbi:MAG: hypothetical protein HON65_15775 [Rhodospirillales bacterium]|nr:hypothetical protein [Rhodospirillales bacterium]
MNQSLEPNHWTYETFRKNTPASEFRQFESFKQLWDSKRKGDSLPAWRDFQIEDFAKWYGWMTVEDIISIEPFDSVYRLWGSNVTTLYDTDLTGKKMSEAEEGVFSLEDFKLGTKMARNQLITLCTGPLKWREVEEKVFSFIEVPLSDDGHTVDKILALTSEHAA